MINPGSITATGLEFAYDDLGDVVYRYQKGETKAIYEIGMAYLEGRGLLKQDKRKAEEYMKKAADKGDSDALAFFENQKKEAEAAEKAKKEKEAEDDRKALELQKVKKVEYAKKLPGKWKVTRLFNDADVWKAVSP